MVVDWHIHKMDCRLVQALLQDFGEVIGRAHCMSLAAKCIRQFDKIWVDKIQAIITKAQALLQGPAKISFSFWQPGISGVGCLPLGGRLQGTDQKGSQDLLVPDSFEDTKALWCNRWLA